MAEERTRDLLIFVYFLITLPLSHSGSPGVDVMIFKILSEKITTTTNTGVSVGYSVFKSTRKHFYLKNALNRYIGYL
jgi:Trk-type K+ transport system membrane component